MSLAIETVVELNFEWNVTLMSLMAKIIKLRVSCIKKFYANVILIWTFLLTWTSLHRRKFLKRNKNCSTQNIEWERFWRGREEKIHRERQRRFGGGRREKIERKRRWGCCRSRCWGEKVERERSLSCVILIIIVGVLVLIVSVVIWLFLVISLIIILVVWPITVTASVPVWPSSCWWV